MLAWWISASKCSQPFDKFEMHSSWLPIFANGYPIVTFKLCGVVRQRFEACFSIFFHVAI